MVPDGGVYFNFAHFRGASWVSVAKNIIELHGPQKWGLRNSRVAFWTYLLEGLSEHPKFMLTAGPWWTAPGLAYTAQSMPSPPAHTKTKPPRVLTPTCTRESAPSPLHRTPTLAAAKVNPVSSSPFCHAKAHAPPPFHFQPFSSLRVHTHTHTHKDYDRRLQLSGLKKQKRRLCCKKNMETYLDSSTCSWISLECTRFFFFNAIKQKINWACGTFQHDELTELPVTFFVCWSRNAYTIPYHTESSLYILP